MTLKFQSLRLLIEIRKKLDFFPDVKLRSSTPTRPTQLKLKGRRQRIERLEPVQSIRRLGLIGVYSLPL